jgi:hypothetical protein
VNGGVILAQTFVKKIVATYLNDGFDLTSSILVERDELVEEDRPL